MNRTKSAINFKAGSAKATTLKNSLPSLHYFTLAKINKVGFVEKGRNKDAVKSISMANRLFYYSLTPGIVSTIQVSGNSSSLFCRSL